MVSEKINNTQIGGKKRSKFYDYIWNIKYLPRFKWAHLGERLAYERAVHKQRLRAEIAQAKREAAFFSSNIDRINNKKKIATASHDDNAIIPVKQSKVDEQESSDRTVFLKSLFT